ncbi:MAG: glycosyltransferase N-terminal domain-containing protein, partial [Geminicoccaceae bacterium]|nr:glycosyltransferase N-terminal domain-containing protein [Geminicoccaceae bacterium]
MLLGLYRVLTTLGGPLLDVLLWLRAKRGKEDPARLAERAGRASLPRPPGRLAWVHGASVGEALAALPLIDMMLSKRPDLQVLLTTGTVTSSRLMTDRLPPRARHQFLPLDRAVAWRRFFDHWRPVVGVLVESELWPNLLAEASRRGLPLALVNGRMSARSFARWRRLPSLAARLLGLLDLC